MFSHSPKNLFLDPVVHTLIKMTEERWVISSVFIWDSDVLWLLILPYRFCALGILKWSQESLLYRHSTCKSFCFDNGDETAVQWCESVFQVFLPPFEMYLIRGWRNCICVNNLPAIISTLSSCFLLGPCSRMRETVMISAWLIKGVSVY